MTYKELEERFEELQAQMKEVQTELRSVRRQMESQMVERTAEEKWNRMSDSERDAIVNNIITPKGVGKKSRVGSVKTG